MKRKRTFGFKMVLCLLLVFLCLTGMREHEVKASSYVSYSRAVSLYDRKIASWARKGTKMKVTADIRNNGCWTSYNDVGKMVSTRSLYYRYDTRYIFKDLDGDKTVEAIFYASNGYVFIFDIQGGKVKVMAVVRTLANSKPIVRYNSKQRTFSIDDLVTVRNLGCRVYRMKNGKLSRVVMLGNYIGPMSANGKSNNSYWADKKKVSLSKYNKYWKTYVKPGKRLYWGP